MALHGSVAATAGGGDRDTVGGGRESFWSLFGGPKRREEKKIPQREDRIEDPL